MTTKQIKQNHSVTTGHGKQTTLRQRRPYAWLSAWVWMILILLALPVRAVLLQGQVALLPGLNLVGIPLDPAQTPTVASLLRRLGDSTIIAAVWRLDPTSGLLQRCGYDAGGQPSGEGCAASVSSGEGWQVEARQAAALPYTVNQPCPGVTLRPGLNLVAFPCATAVTSYNLLPLLGDTVSIASVQGLDPATGRWLTTTYYENQPAGEEFPILPGQAYLVSARSVSALADADFDGLPNTQEIALGTDPYNPDTDGDTFKDSEEVAAHTDPKNPLDTPVGKIPPDPATVAPAIDPTVATTVAAASAFLYSGSNLIQTEVAPGTIDPKRAAVLHGRVTDRNNQPLAGAAITVLNHPEFGRTLSRLDGMFDLAVNGGGYLTVDYQRAGFLPVQRQLNVPWQNFALVKDVVMVQVDTKVTPIDLTNTTQAFQVAQGSVVTDQDGARQATLLFPQGTQAQMVMPDGSTQPLTTLHVRASEYTVGANGPKAMPAELPPASGYTYAVELSVDEALAAGAKSVHFDKPVINYVEDFIGFPIGSAVPSGYYDRDRGQWIAAENGRVVKLLDIVNGSALLDTDGDGNADDDATLAALGVSVAERAQLARLYAPGQALWRVPVAHFSPYDYNWPYGPPDGAKTPSQPEPYNPDPVEDQTCKEEGGSVIECQNQVLGESIPVTGTPFSLNYRSSRAPGERRP